LELHLDSGQWCSIARAGTNLLHLAGVGVAAADVQVAQVTEWEPYGLGLSDPQWVSAVNEAADGRPY